MAHKVTKVAEIVKQVLTKIPKARDDDNYLMCIVYKQYGISWDEKFLTVMSLISQDKLPSMESVVRARRKCQELYPDLRATEQVETGRINKTAEYMTFAQDKEI